MKLYQISKKETSKRQPKKETKKRRPIKNLDFKMHPEIEEMKSLALDKKYRELISRGKKVKTKKPTKKEKSVNISDIKELLDKLDDFSFMMSNLNGVKTKDGLIIKKTNPNNDHYVINDGLDFNKLLFSGTKNEAIKAAEEIRSGIIKRVKLNSKIVKKIENKFFNKLNNNNEQKIELKDINVMVRRFHHKFSIESTNVDKYEDYSYYLIYGSLRDAIDMLYRIYSGEKFKLNKIKFSNTKWETIKAEPV